MDKPLISVIIPTYNRALLLKRTVNSVLNQTLEDFELIIVDDGSTDNTKELVHDLMKKDSRVKYLWQENSGGPSEPRNLGIRNSNGDFISVLDSDDEILPEKLEKQINKFQSVPENIGVIYCGFKYVSKNGKEKIKTITPKLKGHIFTKLLRGNFIGDVTPLVKKECFENSGVYDGSVSTGENWDIWIRISKNYEFDFVKDTLAIYHIHGEQVSASFNDTIEGFKAILEKYKAEIAKYPSIHSEHLIRIGIFHCINGNLKEGQRYFKESTNIKPYQIKAHLNIFFLKISPGLYRSILIYIARRFTLTGMFF